MQINTSSEKIHKLTPLKFDVSESFYLYMLPIYI